MTRATVANLEPDPPLERLAIGQPGLGLDAHRPPSTAHLRVPRPEVALDGQRYLGAPAKSGVNHLPKALEEPPLRPIPQGIPARVGTNGQLQTHYGATRTHELDRRVPRLSSLQSTDVGMRSPNGFGDEALAQPSTDTSIAHVGADAPERSANRPLSAVCWTFPGRHVPAACQRDLSRDSSGNWPPMALPMFQATNGVQVMPLSGALVRPLEHPMFHSLTELLGRGVRTILVRHLEHPAFQVAISASRPRP